MLGSKVVIRKKNFKKKLDLATGQARQALSLSPEVTDTH
jgi:hypothetical protein